MSDRDVQWEGTNEAGDFIRIVNGRWEFRVEGNPRAVWRSMGGAATDGELLLSRRLRAAHEEAATNDDLRIVAAVGELHKPEPAPKINHAWLDKREPCWLCNRALMRMKNGPHRGKYVAAVIEDGGYERHCHVACVEKS